MTPWQLFAAGVGAFVAGLIGTLLQRQHSLRKGIIDVPNARSSHSRPTPRSGGVAIFGASMLAFGALRVFGGIDSALFNALLGGGGAIALVGYLDDRMNLSALLRFVVHLAAASWVLLCLGGVAPLDFGFGPVNLGWPGNVLGVAAIVWVINLFNFMDGIDGIAASEAIFVAAAAATLLQLFGGFDAIGPAAVVLACACAGFLVWNWPPAKIFMGDVGSGYIGFCIATLALAAVRLEPRAIALFLMLGGVFFIDATTTLVRRMVRREHFYQAHRIHAYQWLARRWGGHRYVLLAVIGVNFLWLLPLSYLAMRHSNLLTGLLVLALGALVIVALIAGAGRKEPERGERSA